MDAFVGEKGLMERMRARREFQAQFASLEALKATNAQLREKARRLRVDPAAIESIAREELGLIRPGELLFILRDVKPELRDVKPELRDVRPDPRNVTPGGREVPPAALDPKPTSN